MEVLTRGKWLFLCISGGQRVEIGGNSDLGGIALWRIPAAVSGPRRTLRCGVAGSAAASPSPELLRPGPQGGVTDATAWGDGKVSRRPLVEGIVPRFEDFELAVSQQASWRAKHSLLRWGRLKVASRFLTLFAGDLGLCRSWGSVYPSWMPSFLLSFAASSRW